MGVGASRSADGGGRALVRNLLSQTVYTYSRIVRDDVINAMQSFPDMKPEVGYCDVIPKIGPQLINLRGTIPIFYAGCGYSVPITVWILNDYPLTEPVVRIDVASHMLVPRDYIGVNANGDVTVPIFYDWNADEKSLRRLLESLSTNFSERPPVFKLNPRDITGMSVKDTGFQTMSPLQKLSQSIEILHKTNMTSYQNKDIIIQHLMDVFKNYYNIYPSDGAYGFNNVGETRALMNVKGTIATGPNREVPVVVWIPQNYPTERPFVYVTSSPVTPSLPHEHVEDDGRVNIPYTQQWDKNKSVGGLLEVMCAEFAAAPPIKYGARAALDHLDVLPVIPGNSRPDSDVDSLCKICMKDTMDIVFFLCLHMIACRACAESLTECPVCRETIQRKLRVFPS